MIALDRKELARHKLQRNATLVRPATGDPPVVALVAPDPAAHDPLPDLLERITRVLEREAASEPPQPGSGDDREELLSRIDALQKQVADLSRKRDYAMIPEYDHRGAITNIAIKEV